MTGDDFFGFKAVLDCGNNCGVCPAMIYCRTFAVSGNCCSYAGLVLYIITVMGPTQGLVMGPMQALFLGL